MSNTDLAFIDNILSVLFSDASCAEKRLKNRRLFKFIHKDLKFYSSDVSFKLRRHLKERIDKKCKGLSDLDPVSVYDAQIGCILALQSLILSRVEDNKINLEKYLEHATRLLSKAPIDYEKLSLAANSVGMVSSALDIYDEKYNKLLDTLLSYLTDTDGEYRVANTILTFIAILEKSPKHLAAKSKDLYKAISVYCSPNALVRRASRSDRDLLAKMIKEFLTYMLLVGDIETVDNFYELFKRTRNFVLICGFIQPAQNSRFFLQKNRAKEIYEIIVTQAKGKATDLMLRTIPLLFQNGLLETKYLDKLAEIVVCRENVLRFPGVTAEVVAQFSTFLDPPRFFGIFNRISPQLERFIKSDESIETIFHALSVIVSHMGRFMLEYVSSTNLIDFVINRPFSYGSLSLTKSVIDNIKEVSSACKRKLLDKSFNVIYRDMLVNLNIDPRDVETFSMADYITHFENILNDSSVAAEDRKVHQKPNRVTRLPSDAWNLSASLPSEEISFFVNGDLSDNAEFSPPTRGHHNNNVWNYALRITSSEERTYGSEFGFSRTNFGRMTEDPEQLCLAIRVIRDITFLEEQLEVLHFTKEILVKYIHHTDKKVQRMAIEACLQFTSNKSGPPPDSDRFYLHYTRNPLGIVLQKSAYFRLGIPKGYSTIIINRILTEILNVGISDKNQDTRYLILSSFLRTKGHEEHIIHPDLVKILLLGLNDESFRVKKIVVKLLGYLSEKIPNFILPELRNFFFKLLNQFEFPGLQPSASQGKATKLIYVLVKHAKQLSSFFVAPLFRLFLDKLVQTGETNPLSSTTTSRYKYNFLKTLNKLCKIFGETSPGEVRDFSKILIPYLIKILQDPYSDTKFKIICLRTMKNFSNNFGYTAQLHRDVPNLMRILFDLFYTHSELKLRKAVISLIGSVGMGESEIHTNIPVLKGNANEYLESLMAKKERFMQDIGKNTSVLMLRILMTAANDPRKNDLINLIVRNMAYTMRSLDPRTGMKEFFREFYDSLNNCEIPRKRIHLFRLIIVLSKHFRNIPKWFVESMCGYMLENWETKKLQCLYTHTLKIFIIKKFEDVRSYIPVFYPKIMALLRETGANGDTQESMPEFLRNDRDSCPESATPFNSVLKIIYYLKKDNEPFLHILIPLLLEKIESDTTTDAQKNVLIILLQFLSKKLDISQHIFKLCHVLTQFVTESLGDLRNEVRKNVFYNVLALFSILDRKHHIKFKIFLPMIRNEIRLSRGIHISDDLGRYYKEIDNIHFLDSEMYLPPKRRSSSEQGVQNFDRIENLFSQTSDIRTAEGWNTWFRSFHRVLVEESSFPSVRINSSILQETDADTLETITPILFLAFWVGIPKEIKDKFVKRTVPDILSSMSMIKVTELKKLLEVVEYLDGTPHQIDVDKHALMEAALRCQSYSKAFRFMESCLLDKKVDLASCNLHVILSVLKRTNQQEISIGVYKKLKERLPDIQDNFHILKRLEQWETTVDEIDAKIASETDPDAILRHYVRKIKYLNHLGGWVELNRFLLRDLDGLVKRILDSPSLGEAKKVKTLVRMLKSVLADEHSLDKARLVLESIEKNFRVEIPEFFYLKAIYELRVGSDGSRARAIKFAEAAKTLWIERMDRFGYHHISENFQRAMVDLIQFSNLDAMIEYTNAFVPEQNAKFQWSLRERTRGIEENPSYWSHILYAHDIFFGYENNVRSYVKLVKIGYATGNYRLSENLLYNLIRKTTNPRATQGDDLKALKRRRARKSHDLDYISNDDLSSIWFSDFSTTGSDDPLPPGVMDFHSFKDANPLVVYHYIKSIWYKGYRDLGKKYLKSAIKYYKELYSKALKREGSHEFEKKIVSKLFLLYADWNLQYSKPNTTKIQNMRRVAGYYESATRWNPKSIKAWRMWGGFNQKLGSQVPNASSYEFTFRLKESIRGYATAVILEDSAQNVQDLLRLFTIWLNNRRNPEVDSSFSRYSQRIRIESWIRIIPQLIAHSKSLESSGDHKIEAILESCGKEHPQALVFPISVANNLKNPVAKRVLKAIRSVHPKLSQEASLVSSELIKITILLPEEFTVRIAEVHHLYRKRQCNRVAERLWRMYQRFEEVCVGNPSPTPYEKHFATRFADSFHEIGRYLSMYRHNRSVGYLNKILLTLLELNDKLRILIESTDHLELEKVSPILYTIRDLSLSVPGTYDVDRGTLERIQRFRNRIKIIPSSQNPRKLRIVGDSGREFSFLLKGNEDLRHDERIMQLFGLVNNFLSTNSSTQRLRISRYVVIPFTPQNGIIGWMEKSETIHRLIKRNREMKGESLDAEFRVLNTFTNSYYRSCTQIQRVEAFNEAMARTSGTDIYEVLWHLSDNSENWMWRKRTYSESLALTSVVGYVIGLGDRHLNNIMMNKTTSSVFHVDFGDCFEVAMMRDRLPETVPFRLTRVLEKGLGISSYEGLFRIASERVLNVLKENKSSLLAILEAYVYDPLFRWRGKNEGENEYALIVIGRILDKLEGKDDGASIRKLVTKSMKRSLSVKEQIDGCIREATSVENLVLMHDGWSPFW